jgi:hypothetical protein
MSTRVDTQKEWPEGHKMCKFQFRKLYTFNKQAFVVSFSVSTNRETLLDADFIVSPSPCAMGCTFNVCRLLVPLRS